MSASKMHRWDFIQRMPVIRRIIRKAGQFVCGICRQEFATYNDAYQCLDECWHEVQNLSPVVIKKVFGVGMMYRCRYCSRDYNSDSFARGCAAECRKKQGLAHQQDAQAANIPLPEKKRVRLARPQPVRMVAPRREKKVVAEKQELQIEESLLNAPSIPETSAAAPAPAALNTDIPPVVTTTMAGNEAKDITAKARSKKEFKDLFYRKGAKYLCRYCNAEFFTKMEVEACFNGHFDANGYEKK